MEKIVKLLEKLQKYIEGLNLNSQVKNHLLKIIFDLKHEFENSVKNAENIKNKSAAEIAKDVGQTILEKEAKKLSEKEEVKNAIKNAAETNIFKKIYTKIKNIVKGLFSGLKKRNVVIVASVITIGALFILYAYHKGWIKKEQFKKSAKLESLLESNVNFDKATRERLGVILFFSFIGLFIYRIKINLLIRHLQKEDKASGANKNEEEIKKLMLYSSKLLLYLFVLAGFTFVLTEL